MPIRLAESRRAVGQVLAENYYLKKFITVFVVRSCVNILTFACFCAIIITIMHVRIITRKLYRNVLKATLALIAFVAVLAVSYSSKATLGITEAIDSPLITYANSSRLENGVDTLIPNKLLTDAAQEKADDIINNQYFDHTRTDGLQPWDFIKSKGYDYKYAGENLAIGFDDYTTVHKAWMESPTHKRNILNERFNEIGIGLTRGIYKGKEVVVIVEMFGSD